MEPRRPTATEAPKPVARTWVEYSVGASAYSTNWPPMAQYPAVNPASNISPKLLDSPSPANDASMPA